MAVLLIDGDCALCSGLVSFLAAREGAGRLRFGEALRGSQESIRLAYEMADV